jgi:membrane-bound serine protease (ClpP class)
VSPALTFAADPNHAVALLLLGVLLICLELNKPGKVIFGCTGLLAFLLGIHGLRTLAIRPTAVLMLLAGVLLFAASFRLPLRLAAQAVAAALLIAGLRLLTIAPQVSLVVAILVGITSTATVSWLIHIALRARRNKIHVGPEALIGRTGILHSALNPTGQVEVRGELRLARLADGTSLPSGARVLIRHIEDRYLIVTPHPVLSSPRPE